ncbi:MAG: tetratricopeptide (TPR) repeat protein, partial [Saprospiraceae bacterium]
MKNNSAAVLYKSSFIYLSVASKKLVHTFLPMKKLSTFLMVLSMSFLAVLHAEEQSLTDLQSKVAQSAGNSKINALNDLASMLIKEKPEDAQEYATEAYEMSGKMNYPEGIAMAADNLGLLMLEKYDYENAMKYFVESLSIRNTMNDEKGIATSKNHIGWVFYIQEDMNSAISNLETALQIRNKITDFEGAAETHENLGHVYLHQKTYGKARQYFGQAMDLRIEMEQLQAAVKLAGQLGKIASDMG